MTNKGWRQVVAYVAPSMSNRHSEKAGRKALCGQHVPAFSGLQFLAITRKPSFQSSWNRKLPNFDFWIFLKTFFEFFGFFLVFFYNISDLATAVAAIWAIFIRLFFHNLKDEDLVFSITKSYWKDNYYTILQI